MGVILSVFISDYQTMSHSLWLWTHHHYGTTALRLRRRRAAVSSFG